MDLNILKEHLLELKYPNINVLSKTEEIANVFGIENRIFFLTWIMKYIGNYELPAEQVKLELVLADILHENGLCHSSQKLKFVNGQLAIPEQLIIITRIFKYARTKPVTMSIQPAFTIDNLNASINKDLNLFPIYGPMKLVKPKERLAKINKYQERIDDLKLLIDSMNMELNQNENIVKCDDMEDVNVQDLSEQIQTLEKKVVWLLKLPTENKTEIEFVSDLPGFLKDESKIASQTIRNMKVITNFQSNCKEAPCISAENQELLSVVKKLAHMSDELVI